MVRLRNNSTGKTYLVTEAELESIQANPMLKGMYSEMPELTEPEEIKALRQKQTEASQDGDNETKN